MKKMYKDPWHHKQAWAIPYGMDQPWDGISKTMAHLRREADLPWDDHGFIGSLAELWY